MSKEPASIQELAEELLPELPAENQKEARALLTERLLPAELRGRSEHPVPVRLTELVSQKIKRELASVGPEGRLRVLHALALRAEIQVLAADGLALAVARYLLDQPEALSRGKGWVNAEVQAFLRLSRSEIQSRGEDMLRMLNEASTRAQTELPEVWSGSMHHFEHSRLDLEAAISGDYSRAAGSLQDFLRAVGVETRPLDLH